MKRINPSKVLFIFSLFLSCSSREVRETKYSNGSLEEKFYVIQVEDGSFLRDGSYNKWYENGQKESTGYFIRGKRNGNFKFWYLNGNIKADCSYRNDTLDGNYKSWYENGQLESAGDYKMGKKIGEWLEYYENGQIKFKGKFSNPDVADGEHTSWHKNGKLKEKEFYKNGELEGEYKYWDDRGTLVVHRFFKEGKDVNLPAKFIEPKSKQIIDLSPDGTGKLKYLEVDFFYSVWRNLEGKFFVVGDKFLLKDKIYSLQKFSKDTIIFKNSANGVLFLRSNK